MMILSRETLLEIEEVCPQDYYSDSEQFREGADAFFFEADFEDCFTKFVVGSEGQASQVLRTINRLREKTSVELSNIASLGAKY